MDSHQVTVGHEVPEECEGDGEGPHHEPPVPPVGRVDQAGHQLLHLRPPGGTGVTNNFNIIAKFRCHLYLLEPGCCGAGAGLCSTGTKERAQSTSTLHSAVIICRHTSSWNKYNS